MPSVLSYLAPPVIGAFIGYITNYIAIRMLFRPLKPWRICGIRVPMTPGVIPSRRRALAENIGEMVGDHLLTSQDVSRALLEEGFQQELAVAISRRVDELLHKELGPLPAIIPARFSPYFEAGIKIIRWRSLKHLHHHLDSDSFAEGLAPIITANLENFCQQHLKSLLADEQKNSLAAFVKNTASRFLGSAALEHWLRSSVRTKTGELLSQNESLKSLLPPELIQLILDRLEGEAPSLLLKFGRLLEKPVIHDRIASRLEKILAGVTSIFGSKAAVFGNFIPAEAISQKIKKYLSEKTGNLSSWLFDETTRISLAIILRDQADRWLETPFATLLKDIPPEQIAAGQDWLCDQITLFFKKPETAASLTNFLQQVLAAQSDRPLHELFIALLGEDGFAKSKAMATSELTAMVRSRPVKKILDTLVIELVEKKLLNHPIGALDSILPKEVKNSISGYLLQLTNDLLAREVPALVETLNIRKLVARKVDSLDLLRLEDLLMGIMREQFKYINLIGGLLGFMIGILNLLFLGGG